MEAPTPSLVLDKVSKKKSFELPLSVVLGSAFLVYGILYHAASFAVLGAVFSYDRSSSETAILMNLRDITYIVFTVIGAIIIPRWSARKIIVGALVVMSICALAVPFWSHNFTLAELLFILTGGSFALVRLAAYWLVSLESTQKGQHARRLMHLEGMYFLGVTLSYGVFLPYIQDIDVSWTEAYWVLLPFLLLTIGLQFTHKPYPPPDANETWKNELRHANKSFGGLVVNSIFVISLFCVLLTSAMHVHFIEWTNVFAEKLVDTRNYQFYNLGAMAIIFAVMAVSRLIVGTILQRAGRFFVFAFCLLGLIALILWNGDAFKTLVIVPAQTLLEVSPYSLFLPAMAFLFSPLLPLIFIVVITQASDRQQPLVIGLLLAVHTLTQMFFQPFSTKLYHYFVSYTAFYFILIPLALLLVLFFLVYSDLNRDKRLFHRKTVFKPHKSKKKKVIQTYTLNELGEEYGKDN